MEVIYKLMSESIEKLNEIKDKLHNHTEENMGINIIIDNQDENGMIFVEIENDNGESISIGSESVTDEGFRKIRISTSDIICNEKT